MTTKPENVEADARLKPIPDLKPGLKEEAEDDGETLFSLFRARADDPPAIRYLRAAVIGMGIILLVVFVVVIGRIAYLVSRPIPTAVGTTANSGVASSAQSAPVVLSPDVQVQLPPAARIRSHTLSGNRLSLHYEAGTAEGIMILDLESGRALSHVRVKTGP